jgi:integrase
MIRKKRGKHEVWVYNPTAGRKVYVGTYSKQGTLKEEGTARWAERRAENEFADAATSIRQAVTIRAWAQTWQAEYPRPEATTRAHHKNALKSFLAEFGDRPLDQLTKAEANRVAHQRPHVARTASAMFNDAIRYLEGHDTPNPFAMLVENGKGRQDIDPLTLAEVNRLGEIAVREYGALFGMCFRAMILFAAWTGCRPGELAGMRWTDLDFDNGLLRVDRQHGPDGLKLPKMGKRREIILPTPAADAVRGMPVRDIEWLFTTPRGKQFRKGSWNHYWRPVRAVFEGEQTSTHWLPRRLEAKPDDHLDFYELRHFCGSLLADRGATARDIAEQLGNTEQVCQRVYIHSYRDRARDRIRAAFNTPEPTEQRTDAVNQHTA